MSIYPRFEIHRTVDIQIKITILIGNDYLQYKEAEGVQK